VSVRPVPAPAPSAARPTTKSLGQIAYEAWAASKPGAWTVPWHQIPDQPAWESIGLAVGSVALNAFVDRVNAAHADALAHLLRKAGT